jgi:hypothetical protein
MSTTGFEETQTVYAAEDPRRLIGQVRRFGSAGPAYEVISVDEAGNVEVEVICSGELVKCTVSEVLEDPIADTFP